MLIPFVASKLQRKVTLQNLTSAQRLDNLFPLLYHETLKFIREVAVHPDAGTEKQTQLFESLGRYVYSTFTSQLFGLEVRLRNSVSATMTKNATGNRSLRRRASRLSIFGVR